MGKRQRLESVITRIFEDEELVSFYPTYGYRDGGAWKIPIRAWVHERRRLVEKLVKGLAADIGDADERERKNLKARIKGIVADSESDEKVVFQFEGDPTSEKWRIQREDGAHPESDLNGVVEGFILLGGERASEILEAQGSEDGWLTYHAVSEDHSGVGRVRLIEGEGICVVSDIDDTIKITEIPSGGKVVVKNTFFRDFRTVPGMVDEYRELDRRHENISFHYVSGGPWQLFKPLFQFVIDEGYPEGSFHMKSVPKNLLSPNTWNDLFELLGDATVNQKISQISELMHRFPERKFILVGDSGEHDPEVYAGLRESFGSQIKEIWIRDLVNARAENPDRLAGMRIIEA